MLQPILDALRILVVSHGQSADSSSESDSIPHPTDPRKRFVAGPHKPALSASAHAVKVYLNSVDAIINGLTAGCEWEKAPLTKQQVAKLKEAGVTAIRSELATHPHDIWLIGNCVIEEMSDQSEVSNTVGQMRVRGAIMARECLLNYRINKAVFDAFNGIASPKQREVSDKYMAQPAFRREIIEKNRENWLRRRRGELTNAEMKTYKIASGSSADIRHLPLPSFETYVRTILEWRVMTYRIRYKLDSKQQAAADAILTECGQRAVQTLQSGKSKMSDLWTDVAVALVEPDNARISLRKAVRQFNKELEAQLMPTLNEIDQRLTAILTTDQKTKARPAPPEPEWVQYSEELDAALNKQEKVN